MRCPARETVTVSATSAYSICDGLLRMAHCFIVELPEPKLRDIRYALEGLLVKANRTLEVFEYDLSLNFDGLEIDPGGSCIYRLRFV